MVEDVDEAEAKAGGPKPAHMQDLGALFMMKVCRKEPWWD